MKRLTATFTVFLDDDQFDFEEKNRGMPGIAGQFFYDHVCDWEGNIHGTVDGIFDHIEDNVQIGDSDIFETVRIAEHNQLKTENEVFRRVFHYINTHAAITMNAERMQEIIGAICSWSYAHRCGNGELSDEEQQARIDSAFYKIKQIVRAE